MTLDVWRGMTRALTMTLLAFAALNAEARAQDPLPASGKLPLGEAPSEKGKALAPGRGVWGEGGLPGQDIGARITLTLDQAIARARAHAERVAATRVALDDGEARAGLAGRRITSNPSVEALFGGAANPASSGSVGSPGSPSPGVPGASGNTTTATEITVTQMFDIGARRTSRIGEAQASIAADRARASDITRAWVREAALLFVRALHASSRERLLASAEETAAAFLTVAERRYAAGDVAVLDVNVARAALAKARADRRSLAADRVDVIGQLRARLGMTAADGPIAVEGQLDVITFAAATSAATDAPTSLRGRASEGARSSSARASGATAEPTTADVGSATAGADAGVQALADHPALATFRSELAEAEAGLAAARASTAPEFGGTSKYMRDQGSNVWLGGVTLTLPIANRGRERQAIAAARVSRARIALDLEQRTLEQDVRTAVETHRLRVEAARLLEREALPGLEENDALARRSYEAGELSLTDSLAIRQQALDMRLAHADRLLDAATSGVLAQAAAGVLR
jgi:cobalt-zinc-cadmium efflux system outer membrane protein